jgi:hypothetical protein
VREGDKLRFNGLFPGNRRPHEVETKRWPRQGKGIGAGWADEVGGGVAGGEQRVAGRTAAAEAQTEERGGFGTIREVPGCWLSG